VVASALPVSPSKTVRYSEAVEHVAVLVARWSAFGSPMTFPWPSWCVAGLADHLGLAVAVEVDTRNCV